MSRQGVGSATQSNPMVRPDNQSGSGSPGEIQVQSQGNKEKFYFQANRDLNGLGPQFMRNSQGSVRFFKAAQPPVPTDDEIRKLFLQYRGGNRNSNFLALLVHQVGRKGLHLLKNPRTQGRGIQFLDFALDLAKKHQIEKLDPAFKKAYLEFYFRLGKSLLSQPGRENEGLKYFQIIFHKGFRHSDLVKELYPLFKDHGQKLIKQAKTQAKGKQILLWAVGLLVNDLEKQKKGISVGEAQFLRETSEQFVKIGDYPKALEIAKELRKYSRQNIRFLRGQQEKTTDEMEKNKLTDQIVREQNALDLWEVQMADWAIANHDRVLAHAILINTNDNQISTTFELPRVKAEKLLSLYKDPASWLKDAEYWLKRGDFHKAWEHQDFSTRVSYGVLFLSKGYSTQNFVRGYFFPAYGKIPTSQKKEFTNGELIANKKDLSFLGSPEFCKRSKEFFHGLREAEIHIITRYRNLKNDLAAKKISGNITDEELAILAKIPTVEKMMWQLDHKIFVTGKDFSGVYKQIRQDLMMGLVLANNDLLARAQKNYFLLVRASQLEAKRTQVKQKFKSNFDNIPKPLQYILNLEGDEMPEAVRKYRSKDLEPTLKAIRAQKWYQIYQQLYSPTITKDPVPVPGDVDSYYYFKTEDKTPQVKEKDLKLARHWELMFQDFRGKPAGKKDFNTDGLHDPSSEHDLEIYTKKLSKIYEAPEVEEIFKKFNPEQDKAIENHPEVVFRQALGENIRTLLQSKDTLLRLEYHINNGVKNIDSEKVDVIRKRVLKRLANHEKFLEQEVKRIRLAEEKNRPYKGEKTSVTEGDLPKSWIINPEYRSHASLALLNGEKDMDWVSPKEIAAKKELKKFQAQYKPLKRELESLEIKDTQKALKPIYQAYKKVLILEEEQACSRLGRQLMDVYRIIPDKKLKKQVKEYGEQLAMAYLAKEIFDFPARDQRVKFYLNLSKEIDDLNLIATTHLRESQLKYEKAKRSPRVNITRKMGTIGDVMVIGATAFQVDPEMRNSDLDLNDDLNLAIARYEIVRGDYLRVRKDVAKKEAAYLKIKTKHDQANEEFIKFRLKAKLKERKLKKEIAWAKARKDPLTEMKGQQELKSLKKEISQKAQDLKILAKELQSKTRDLTIAETMKKEVSQRIFRLENGSFWEKSARKTDRYDTWYYRTGSFAVDGAWEVGKIALAGWISGGVGTLVRGAFAARGVYAGYTAGQAVRFGSGAWWANRAVTAANASTFFVSNHVIQRWDQSGDLFGIFPAIWDTAEHIYDNPLGSLEGAFLDYVMFEGIALGQLLYHKGFKRAYVDRKVKKSLGLNRKVKFDRAFFQKNPHMISVYEREAAKWGARFPERWAVTPGLNPDFHASRFFRWGAFGTELLSFQGHEFLVRSWNQIKEGNYNPIKAAEDAFWNLEAWVQSFQFLLGLKLANHHLASAHNKLNSWAARKSMGKDYDALQEIRNEYAELLADVMLDHANGEKNLKPHLDKMRDLLAKEEAIYKRNPVAEQMFYSEHYHLLEFQDQFDFYRESYHSAQEIFGKENAFGVEAVEPNLFRFSAKKGMEFIEALGKSPQVAQVHISANGQLVWVCIRGIQDPQTQIDNGERILYFRASGIDPHEDGQKWVKQLKKIAKANKKVVYRQEIESRPVEEVVVGFARIVADDPPPSKTVTFETMDLVSDKPNSNEKIYEVKTSPAGLVIYPKEGSNLITVAKNVLEAESSIPNQRIVLTTQNWKEGVEVSGSLQNKFRALAESYGFTISLKNRDSKLGIQVFEFVSTFEAGKRRTQGKVLAAPTEKTQISESEIMNIINDLTRDFKKIKFTENEKADLVRNIINIISFAKQSGAPITDLPEMVANKIGNLVEKKRRIAAYVRYKTFMKSLEKTPLSFKKFAPKKLKGDTSLTMLKRFLFIEKKGLKPGMAVYRPKYGPEQFVIKTISTECYLVLENKPGTGNPHDFFPVENN